MNTVTVDDLGDLGLYSLQPERQRNMVGKLTLIGITRKDVELLLADAQQECKDPQIRKAILAKLLNGPQQDILQSVMQLRRREERRLANPTLNPLYEKNAEQQRKINQEFADEQRRKEAGEVAPLERKPHPWERLKKVD